MKLRHMNAIALCSGTRLGPCLWPARWLKSLAGLCQPLLRSHFSRRTIAIRLGWISLTVGAGSFDFTWAQSNIETPFAISTFAGAAAGSTDGAGAVARFNTPMGIAVDSRGNVYIADSQPVELFEDFTQGEIWPAGNSTIRKIAPTGTVTTVAGTSGIYGSADGTGGGAQFFDPFGVAADGAGNLYVADTFNNTVRKISASGIVATLAGAPGVSGSADGKGTAGRFSNPYGIAVDSAGNAYVADTNNDTVRRITPGGVVTTFAGAAGIPGSADGAGPSARFNQPFGIAVDSSGTVYVADSGNSTIRKITPDGTVTTLAGQAGVYGSADGVGAAARLSRPLGVAVDGAGFVYVADTGNCTIRKVTPAGTVSTLAGLAGVPGDSDGIGSSARFDGANGVAADALGDVYVADSSNGTVRMITPAGVVTTLAGLPRCQRLEQMREQLYASYGRAVDFRTIQPMTPRSAVAVNADANATSAHIPGASSWRPRRH